MTPAPPAVGPGEIAALGTAVCWSFTALFFAAASRRIGAGRVNRIRILLAVVLLGGAVLLSGSGAAIPPGQAACLGLSGIVGLALGDAAYFRSLEILGPRRASLLMTLAPVFTALLMVPLLDEVLGPVGLAGMALTIGGVAWVQAERAGDREVAGSPSRGVAFGVLGALGQAGGYVLAKVGLGAAPAAGRLAAWAGLESRQDAGGDLAGEPVAPLFGTFLRMVAAALGVTVAAMLRPGRPKVRDALSDRPAMWLTLGGAVCGPFLGVWLSLVAVSLTNTAVASTITSASPIFVIPLVLLVHRQRASWRAWAGAVIAVGGLAVLAFRPLLMETFGR